MYFIKYDSNRFEKLELPIKPTYRLKTNTQSKLFTTVNIFSDEKKALDKKIIS